MSLLAAGIKTNVLEQLICVVNREIPLFHVGIKKPFNVLNMN